MRSVFIVHTNATAGHDDEFNDWYTNVHVPEILSIPGFVAAQRFAYDPAGRPADAPVPEFRYLAIYELEGDPGEVAAALAAALPGLTMSPTFEAQKSLLLYLPLTDRVVAEGDV